MSLFIVKTKEESIRIIREGFWRWKRQVYLNGEKLEFDNFVRVNSENSIMNDGETLLDKVNRVSGDYCVRWEIVEGSVMLTKEIK